MKSTELQPNVVYRALAYGQTTYIFCKAAKHRPYLYGSKGSKDMNWAAGNFICINAQDYEYFPASQQEQAWWEACNAAGKLVPEPEFLTYEIF